MYDVYLDEEVSIRAEVDDYSQVVLHLNVSNWAPSVCKKLKRLATDLKGALSLEGFETAYTITPNPKFVKLVFGGKVLDNITYEGVEYEVVVWDLK